MKNYVVLSIIQCIAVQGFRVNADKIVICPVPYISLHVSKRILGRTAEIQRLCAHFTHHCIRRPRIAFPFVGGSLSYCKLSKAGSCICWPTGHFLYQTEDFRYFQIHQCQVVHVNGSDTAQHFVLLTFLYKRLTVEDTKTELVKAFSHHGKAHLDLTWGLSAVRLSFMEYKCYSHCLQSVIH
jgi:hypothetical protein